jgi:cobalt/nickel transport protein
MSATRSVLLLAAAAAIIAAPLAVPGLKGEFKGADDLGAEAILASRPDYKPWFEPLWKPPSSEVETMLFALQAALGAGVLGYVIGRRHSSSNRDAGGR